MDPHEGMTIVSVVEEGKNKNLAGGFRRLRKPELGSRLKKHLISGIAVLFLLFLSFSTSRILIAHPSDTESLMAVQAQYPSNVCLLNPSRNNPEGKIMLSIGDFILQSQVEEVIHNSQMPHSNGGSLNSRKRARETITVAAETPLNLPQPQLQIPSVNLAELALLQNQSLPFVSTGLRLTFAELQQKQRLRGLFLPHVPSSSSSLSDDLALQSKQNREEMNQLLQSQFDELRRIIEQKQQSDRHSILAAAGKSAAKALRERDAALERVARLNSELEERAARLQAEAQLWQARALAHEATASSLQAHLLRAMAEEELGLRREDAESAHVDPSRGGPAMPACRVCRERYVSVLLLPCRHLCVCAGCDGKVERCPVCHVGRSSSLDVHMS